MLNIRFHHIKELLRIYLIWAVLNLLLAFVLCRAAGQLSNQSSLSLFPLIWLMLHIAPFWEIIFGGSQPCFIFPSIISLFLIIIGILINKQWASSLIIIGMTIWFLLSFCILGVCL
ncbi:MAG: hypothetical protein ABSB11_08705 [Sedimentisphaerales bacterium]|jgi:urea transporter